MLNNLAAVRIASLDPTLNLALEEHLFNTLNSAESPAAPYSGLFLLWQNDPSVIVGRHQNTAEEVNAAFIRENAIPVVRRTTGGGAVYHDEGNLNFSFLVKTEGIPHQKLPGFGDFLAPVTRALADLGIAAEFSSRNDITVGGRKISGSARRQTNRALLQHGTVLVNLAMDRLGAALAGNPDKFTSKGVASHKSRVANLSEFLPAGWSPQQCMAALTTALQKHCAIRHITLSASDMEAAEALAQSRYRNWDWNYGASPPFTEKKRRRFAFGAVELCLAVEQGRITQCRIFGDFFSESDVRAVEQSLEGCPHKTEDLRKAFARHDLAAYFSGCDPAELLAFFLE